MAFSYLETALLTRTMILPVNRLILKRLAFIFSSQVSSSQTCKRMSNPFFICRFRWIHSLILIFSRCHFDMFVYILTCLHSDTFVYTRPYSSLIDDDIFSKYFCVYSGFLFFLVIFAGILGISLDVYIGFTCHLSPPADSAFLSDCYYVSRVLK